MPNTSNDVDQEQLKKQIAALQQQIDVTSESSDRMALAQQMLDLRQKLSAATQKSW